ncbi:MAG: RsmB/NOP family class I SAM-dependent RNA methyltransferase [Erysipelotrichaceae bacterium]|nr:RsmB/NOP family class I SAM-dependent RNA methyltransferase [Erysipelotrichaceae bacterium]
MNDIFLKRIKEYFPHKYNEYLECLNIPCTKGFFINHLKGSTEDIKKIIDFDYFPSDLSEESYYHDEENIGKTKAYELGLIYPQEIAASLTTKDINPDEINTVVDLCAAPGGKTINIINRLNREVLLISNDNSHLRASILSSNIERMGFDNVIVTNKETSVLAEELEGFADLVILDAPCSGEGMVRKYPEIIDNYNLNNIYELSDIQKKILEDAYKICKNKGMIIYSTCTYAFEEDEDQIISFLERHKDMELIPYKDSKGSKLEGAIKLSPLDNTEGQFMVMLRKNGEVKDNRIKYLKPVKEKLVDDFIKENTDISKYYLYKHNDKFYISFMPLPDMKHNVLKYGVQVGEIINKRFEPSHHFYRSNHLRSYFRYVYDLSDEEYDRYISGNEIHAETDNHYYLITYKGYSLGYGKCSNHQIKNKYPKGLRRVV